MGNLKLNTDVDQLIPKKIDINDPEIKRMIDDTVRAQEAILALKIVTRESLEKVITI